MRPSKRLSLFKAILVPTASHSERFSHDISSGRLRDAAIFGWILRAAGRARTGAIAHAAAIHADTRLIRPRECGLRSYRRCRRRRRFVASREDRVTTGRCRRVGIAQALKTALVDDALRQVVGAIDSKALVGAALVGSTVVPSEQPVIGRRIR
jgi:hypothetical protein